MDKKRLLELKKYVQCIRTNGWISLMKSDDLLTLIDAALSHDATTDAEVQKAIDSRRIVTIISELEEFANQRLDGNYIPPDLSRGEVLDVVIPILRNALQQCRTEPCRVCGCKRIKQWCSQTYGYVYRCDYCDEGFEYRQTVPEARIAWNEAQKGGET